MDDAFGMVRDRADDFDLVTRPQQRFHEWLYPEASRRDLRGEVLAEDENAHFRSLRRQNAGTLNVSPGGAANPGRTSTGQAFFDV